MGILAHPRKNLLITLIIMGNPAEPQQTIIHWVQTLDITSIVI